MSVHVLDHPLLQHKLTWLRKKETGTREFREITREIAMLMTYEITRNFPLEPIEIETPLCKTTSNVLAGKKVAIVPILRAGLGMVDGVLDVIPSAKVGHIGLYRNEETLQPVKYYFKMPKDIDKRSVIITEPMLATGGSLIAAVSMLKEEGIKDINIMSLVVAEPGIKALEAVHPDIHVYCVGYDKELNEHGYITPGLGDAGDRLFGTK